MFIGVYYKQTDITECIDLCVFGTYDNLSNYKILLALATIIRF